jgi:hypothetical protein
MKNMAIHYKQVSKHSYRKIKPQTIEELKNYFDCEIYDEDGLQKALDKHKHVYCHIRPKMEDDESILDWFLSEEDATESYFTIIENF